MLRIVESCPWHAGLLIGYARIRSQAQISYGVSTVATERRGIMEKVDQHDDATGCNSSEQDEWTKSFQAHFVSGVKWNELLSRTHPQTL